MATLETQLCPKCKKLKNLDASNYKAGHNSGTFSKTCLPCLAQTSEKYTLKKTRKENKENPENLRGEDQDQWVSLSKLKLDLFLETISATDVTSFTALVDISLLICSEIAFCGKADLLAKSIWNRLKYRFM